jgi:hypothetical protein
LQPSRFALTLAQNRNAFILVLIDGDGTIFEPDLLAKGEVGGKEAAALLHSNLIDFASTHLDCLPEVRVAARIYADVAKLADKLIKCKEIDGATVLQDFIRGFNGSRLLFDFVDTGEKEDAVGDKLSENLRMSLHDCHCHALVLGCSHNSEYAEVIQEVSCDDETADRLVLLEGVPFVPELAELQSSLRSVRFDGVFRSTKLTLPRMPTAPLPVLAKVEPTKPSTNTSAASTPQMNWATVTAQAHSSAMNATNGSSPVPATVKAANQRSVSGSNGSAGSVSFEPVKKSSSSSSSSSKTVSTNRLGQRIDRVDDSIPNYEIQRVKKLKLCNTFYLQGQKCTSSHCNHTHDHAISNYERKVLREVARMTPCYYRTDCDDPDCIYGHRCPQSKPDEPGCYYGENCRFFGWGHGIDTRVCKTVRV